MTYINNDENQNEDILRLVSNDSDRRHFCQR